MKFFAVQSGRTFCLHFSWYCFPLLVSLSRFVTFWTRILIVFVSCPVASSFWVPNFCRELGQKFWKILRRRTLAGCPSTSNPRNP